MINPESPLQLLSKIGEISPFEERPLLGIQSKMRGTSIQIDDDSEITDSNGSKDEKKNGLSFWQYLKDSVMDKPRIPYNDRFMLSPWQVPFYFEN